eukprot:jgi/Hompol1/1096/HPOL_001629-RA
MSAAAAPDASAIRPAGNSKLTLKELKIKSGVLKRTGKELLSYKKEAEKQQARIDKLVADGADNADIRKQHEVLDETVQILPDTKRRLEIAYKELVDALAAFAVSISAIEMPPKRRSISVLISTIMGSDTRHICSPANH